MRHAWTVLRQIDARRCRRVPLGRPPARPAATIAARLAIEASPSSSGRRSTRELRDAIFRDAATIVEREFAEHITVEEIAPRVASSPRQLRRAFAEVAGVSFRSYLATVRTNRAAELLASTDLAVKDIAGRVGYREASALTRAFRRTHGVSPSEFRRVSRGES